MSVPVFSSSTTSTCPLQVFYDNAPVLVLVTTLVTFGLLSQRNEVVAAKALGFSLFRLAVPALFAAVGVALLSAALENSVLTGLERESR